MNYNDLIAFIKQATETATDEVALKATELYKEWKTDTEYKVNDRRRYGNELYKCLQAHISQSDWTPDATPALWKRVYTEEWPEWVQPTGAHDAYAAGDKVTHGGVKYVSDVDSNVWEPGVYGWTEYTEA